MGGEQAANVLVTVKVKRLQEQGVRMTEEEKDKLMRPILEKYEEEASPYFSTARLWDDGLLDPLETREALALGISMSLNAPIPDYKVGIFRM
jgi:acetyl-CoA carboxylase carboxyltransferase component